MDKEEPSGTKEITDKVHHVVGSPEPTNVSPVQESVEDIRMKPRIDNEEPTFVNWNVDVFAPSLAIDRREREEPNCTNFITDMAMGKQQARTDNEEPVVGGSIIFQVHRSSKSGPPPHVRNTQKYY